MVQWLVQRFRSERLRVRSRRSATFTPSAHVRRQSLPVWPPTLKFNNYLYLYHGERELVPNRDNVAQDILVMTRSIGQTRKCKGMRRAQNRRWASCLSCRSGTFKSGDGQIPFTNFQRGARESCLRRQDSVGRPASCRSRDLPPPGQRTTAMVTPIWTFARRRPWPRAQPHQEALQ